MFVRKTTGLRAITSKTTGIPVGFPVIVIFSLLYLQSSYRLPTNFEVEYSKYLVCFWWIAWNVYPMHVFSIRYMLYLPNLIRNSWHFEPVS